MLPFLYLSISILGFHIAYPSSKVMPEAAIRVVIDVAKSSSMCFTLMFGVTVLIALIW